jgi:hypothetical protein
MQKSPAKKGAPQRMRKVTINLYEDLVRALKMRAAKELTTVVAIVTRAIQRELKEGGESGKK